MFTLVYMDIGYVLCLHVMRPKERVRTVQPLKQKKMDCHQLLSFSSLSIVFVYLFSYLSMWDLLHLCVCVFVLRCQEDIYYIYIKVDRYYNI